MTAECVKTYALVVNDDGEIVGEEANPASEKLAEKMNAYLKANPTARVDDAVRHLEQHHPELVRLYGEAANGNQPDTREYAEDPSSKLQAIIHAKASQIVELSCCSYSDAVSRVLREEPDLAKQYAG